MRSLSGWNVLLCAQIDLTPSCFSTCFPFPAPSTTQLPQLDFTHSDYLSTCPPPDSSSLYFHLMRHACWPKIQTSNHIQIAEHAKPSRQASQPGNATRYWAQKEAFIRVGDCSTGNCLFIATEKKERFELWFSGIFVCPPALHLSSLTASIITTFF